MPLEAPLPPLEVRAAALNDKFRNRAGFDVLEHALRDPEIGPTALVSSFGAESVVLLHMVSLIDRTTPVLFLDTEMLFPETLEYQRDLARRLKLNVEVIRPDRETTFLADPNSRLHVTNPDACCALRKSEPLTAALKPYGAWITGRKRFQGGSRASLETFEVDEARLKVNPLAHWTSQNVRDWIDNNRLPRHPLVAKGFASIGCAPCTTRVDAGEPARAGRWRNQDKTECGIHLGASEAVA